MHKPKSEIRQRIKRRKGKSRRRVRYILPSRIIGTLGEDEPKSCKSNELIFTKATNNSGGHTKTTVTCWIEAVLSWILFICSVGIAFSTGRHARKKTQRGRVCVCMCVNGGVKDWKDREHVYIFIINIVSTIAARFGNTSNVRPEKAAELKWIDTWNQRGERAALKEV